jgi:hypothetical protein
VRAMLALGISSDIATKQLAARMLLAIKLLLSMRVLLSGFR